MTEKDHALSLGEAKTMFEKVWVENEKEQVHPRIDTLVTLGYLQFLSYDDERQQLLNGLRKKIWAENCPTGFVAALLFLVEVPRIAHKTHGADREAGDFVGTCGLRYADGKPYELKPGDRECGINLRLTRAKEALKPKTTKQATVETAAA